MLLKGKKAQQFVDDIAAGVNDDELRKKYSLSPRGVVFLRKKVAAYLMEKEANDQASPPRMSSSQLMEDVRAGMDDDELMKKYSLSRRELQRFFREAIQAGHTTALELSQRLCITQSQVSEAFSEIEQAIKEMG
jgi:uncharacterized protein (DUF433 family)